MKRNHPSQSKPRDGPLSPALGFLKTTDPEDAFLVQAVLAWLEVTWYLFEYNFGTYIIKATRLYLFEVSDVINSVLAACERLAILLLLCIQFSRSLELTQPEFWARAWGRRRLRRGGGRGSGAAAALALTLAGPAAAALAQAAAGRWRFSLDHNFRRPDGSWRRLRAVDVCLLAPLQEEVLCRLLFYHLVHRRLQNRNISIWAVSTLFGLMHLSNLGSSNYSTEYVIFQTALATLVGAFYAGRLLAARSLAEPLALHALNNALGALLPTRGPGLSFADPAVLLPLLLTGVMYGMAVSKAGLLDFSMDQQRKRRQQSKSQQEEDQSCCFSDSLLY